jgi:hypothetical protein
MFTLGKKSVKMDFSSGKSYRYEHVFNPHHSDNGPFPTMCYGEWSHDEFILFIYRKLLNE